MTEPNGRPQPPGWELVWADEFDAVAGTPPDPATWVHALGDGTADGNPGWGNQELESYTDDPANASMDGNGNLVITALAAEPGSSGYYGPCEYTSARLLTRGRFSVEYGRVEARIKVPAGHGLWPAFWMLGTDIETVRWPACGEIDVMENIGREPHRLYGTIHGPGYSGNHGFGKTIDLAAPLAEDFHSYAVDWRAGEIVWAVDGTTYHRATPADVAPNAWPFDHEFYLLLNLAVGGEMGGPVAPDTAFPASLVVDHVRVYRAT